MKIIYGILVTTQIILLIIISVLYIKEYKRNKKFNHFYSYKTIINFLNENKKNIYYKNEYYFFYSENIATNIAFLFNRYGARALINSYFDWDDIMRVFFFDSDFKSITFWGEDRFITKFTKLIIMFYIKKNKKYFKEVSTSIREFRDSKTSKIKSFFQNEIVFFNELFLEIIKDEEGEDDE